MCVQGAVERVNQTIKRTISGLLLTMPTVGRCGWLVDGWAATCQPPCILPTCQPLLDYDSLITPPSAPLLRFSWAAHVLDVQKAVNNMPHEAHGGTLTPSQVLFGQPEAASLLPKPDQLAELLGFVRCAWGRSVVSKCRLQALADAVPPCPCAAYAGH